MLGPLSGGRSVPSASRFTFSRLRLTLPLICGPDSSSASVPHRAPGAP